MARSDLGLKEVLAYDCGHQSGYLDGVKAAIRAVEKVKLAADDNEWVSASLWDRISGDIAARHIRAIKALIAKGTTP